MGAKPWGRDGVKSLFEGIGSFGLSWFRARVDDSHSYPNAPKGRSRQAIENKALRDWGSGGLTRGSYSLRAAILVTGYSRTQLLRARDALRQKWKRFGPRGNFLVSDDQLEDAVAWLQHDYWSIAHRLYCCRGCTSDRKAHYALGLCLRCYWRYRREMGVHGLPLSSMALGKIVARVAASRSPNIFLDRVTLCVSRGISLETEMVSWLAQAAGE